MPFATRAGVRLYVDQAGSGPPLLIISGTGGDLRNRPNPLDWPLRERFSVVAFDQRGLGRSDKPAVPYSMADYADDAAAVLDWVGVDHANVLGVSFGGMVAQELTLRHPDRVGRLVLACTSSGGAGRPSFPLHELNDLDDENRAIKIMELLDARWDGSWRAANPVLAAAILDTTLRPPADDGGRRQLEARRHHDTWDRLPAIRSAVLVCAGRYDSLAPVENSEAIVRQIPGATLRVFDGGHLFFDQDPTAFPAMVEFLAS